MTQPITTRGGWKARLGQIADAYPQAAGLLRRGTLARDLWSLSPHSPTFCRDVLALLQPALGVPPQKAQPWLLALYQHLADQRFPDEARGHPRRPFSPEEALYLALLDLALQHRPDPFDPLMDLLPLPPESLDHSPTAADYQRFLQAAQEEHILALFTLGRELMPFDPAAHTIGVHNVALHTAILARQAGLPVDLPLVRAAAFGHDLGKFGCRGAEAQRIPYLHYYYTWQWFREHDLESIGHISANHSTWDLECENLPMESLLLIYADFRVRGQRDENGREHMAIYTLDQARDLIFSKLADMTPAKQRRYETVYRKLRDFEHYLRAHGVPTDLEEDQLRPVTHTDPALLFPEGALERLRDLTFANSIHLMATVAASEPFAQLLERAKGAKNTQSIRTYLHLLEEYNTYMTASNRRKTLALLYELLMHPEGDVRQKAGQIMGQILANSEIQSQKERPASASEMPPAMVELLEEAVSLWEDYILQCLHPDRKVAAKHAQRISNSLKVICRSLFQHCTREEAQPFLPPLLRQLWQAEGAREQFILADALCQVPLAWLPAEVLPPTAAALGRMLQAGQDSLALAALRCLEQLRLQRPEDGAAAAAPLAEAFVPPAGAAFLALEGMRRRVLGLPMEEIDGQAVSDLYLSDLKNAVPWLVKLVQVDLLTHHAQQHPEAAFHTAMHLSNLLSLSEHLPVREHAGKQLLSLCPHLTVAQVNEIAIDLLRELESGQDQISRFIPPYAGPILCLLPEREFQEALDLLDRLARGPSVAPARAAFYTLGEVLKALPAQANSAARRVLGCLMTGVSHYREVIHRTALLVLCREVFGSPALSLERKGDFFLLLHKKLLTILSEPRGEALTFFSQAAMLNHLYRFLVQYEVQVGPFAFPPLKPAAFFPGTFDPFSVGHKKIVEEIRAQGFQVYLAVDEFSWSKRTLPKGMRRKIVGLSVADQWDTYLFPDDIPVNLAAPADLAKLKALLHDPDFYLVMGTDVIAHASAYRSKAPGSAREYNHIVFTRAQEGQPTPDLGTLGEILQRKVLPLSLPPFFEGVSSTRIRASVDQDLDISMLVDPVVQAFIYDTGCYVRAPARKRVLRRQDMHFQFFRSPAQALPQAMEALLRGRTCPMGTVLRLRPHEALLGWAAGHTLRMGNLYEAMGSLEGAAFVRQHTSGRILMVDQVQPEGDPAQAHAICRMLLNELLARSLEADHTYALCRCPDAQSPLGYALAQLGFLPVPGQEDVFCVDMRSPVVLLQDVFLHIKEPHRDSDGLKAAVAEIRPKLRAALTQLFPGKLVLCFDSELLNQALMERVQQLNGVAQVPPGQRQLGPYMCVPYGKILADTVVDNTVTKTLHAEKRFLPSMEGFDIVESPGHSPLRTQIRTLKSFYRPVILVDDLLHHGYRIEKLDRLLREEALDTRRLIVAILSGYGRDLMKVQGRQVDCEYFIPNLHYWVTESLLYPFVGGDSIGPAAPGARLLPSINLILPYYYPRYLSDATDEGIWRLSRTALENGCALLQALEKEHQAAFHTALTIGTLGEALEQPRLPRRGLSMPYDPTLPPSAYLADDLAQLERIAHWKGDGPHDV